MTDDTKKRIRDLLKQAIKGEEDGYRFYALLADKAVNPDAKRKLQMLRDDEARHKRTLFEIFERTVGGEIGKLPEKGIGPLAEAFRGGRIDEQKSEMEFINLAIETELAASRYYQEGRDSISDAESRTVFDQLAEEEYRHYEILQA